MKEISLPLLKVSTNEYSKSIAKKQVKNNDELDNNYTNTTNNNTNSISNTDECDIIDNICKGGDDIALETGTIENQPKNISSSPNSRNLSPINTGNYFNYITLNLTLNLTFILFISIIL